MNVCHGHVCFLVVIFSYRVIQKSSLQKTSSKKSIAGYVGGLTPPAPSTQDTFFPHRVPGKGGRSPWRSRWRSRRRRRRRRRRDRCVIPSEALPVHQWCFAGPLGWVAGWVGLGRFSRMPWGFAKGICQQISLFFFFKVCSGDLPHKEFFWIEREKMHDLNQTCQIEKKSGQWLVACKTHQSFLLLLDFCFTSFISLKKFDLLEGDFSRNLKKQQVGTPWTKNNSPPKNINVWIIWKFPTFFCCFFRSFFVVVIFVTKKSQSDAWNSARNGGLPCGACYEAPHETGGQKAHRFEFFFMRLISMKFIGI